MSRRTWLARLAAAGLIGRSGLGALGWAKTPQALAAGGIQPDGETGDRRPDLRPTIAVVVTACFHRSHAHVLLENFLEPYLFCGQLTQPLVKVAALYAHQFPANDMLRSIEETYAIPVYDSISAALCQGGDRLAVDGVVSIGEHGEYPATELGQTMYPRKEFFDEIVGVFRRSKRVVPVFNDKHLSYRGDWAREMVDVSRELQFPMLAGSSVPLAQRIPALELPAESKIVEAVSIHGGPAESYGFHGLEVLQSIVEARHGGETGISRVTALTAEQLRAAAKEGRWSPELASAAMRAEESLPGRTPLADPLAALDHGFLLDYRDGTRGVVLKVGNDGIRWNFACRLQGEDAPRACAFYVGPWNNRSLFRALANAIQVMVVENQAPYPVERTLLTTLALEAAVQSLAQQGQPVETPQLDWAYRAPDWTRVRENGETWRTITPDTPEPVGMKRDGEPAAAG